MYIRFYFQKNGEVIDLNDGKNIAPLCYHFTKPDITDSLTDNDRENKAVERVNGDMTYHLNCGDLDRATVEKIITEFANQHLKNNDQSRMHFADYGSVRVDSVEKDGMQYINKVLEALVKAKMELAAKNHLKSQSIFTRRNVLTVAGGFALGVAVTAAAAVTLKK